MRPRCLKKGADYGAEVPVLVPSSFPLRGTTFIDLHRKRGGGNWRAGGDLGREVRKTPRKARVPPHGLEP